MFENPYLLAFAIAAMGCVFSTPLVIRLATRVGAIDQPDQFRRVHQGSVPRLGGLALAVGLALSIVPVVAAGYLNEVAGIHDLWSWWARQWPIFIAAAIVLAIGAIDDTRGMKPRPKLLGQTLAVLVLVVGGIQIKQVAILGLHLDLSHPSINFPLDGTGVSIGLPGLIVTMLWFLGCMNVWNLIDGMDGLASGVGVLVSGTLMLVAVWQDNVGSAILAASLAGSLAGFLLYNWHPACIFLGDSGSLLIGLLIGVIGVQDSLKGTTTVTILFPILAMGLPVSDTAMAIFRRWVRHLPLSAADRQHVHHLLLGAGLNPRQAAGLLYCFSAGLCGVVLLGVALRNEVLALVLGVSGCLAFLLVLTSRRNELAQLQADLRSRMQRGRQERAAAKATWESIQKIELCHDPERIWGLVVETARALGCDVVKMTCHRDGRTFFQWSSTPSDDLDDLPALSGPTATFRLPSGRDLLLVVSVHQADANGPTADIAFRFLQRLSLATAERFERLLSTDSDEPKPEAIVDDAVAGFEPEPQDEPAPPTAARSSIGWLRRAWGGSATH